jgi:hypothetical protein
MAISASVVSIAMMLCAVCGGSDNHANTEGVFERAGKSVDKAANKTADATKKAAKKVGNAADKTGKKIKKKTDGN